MGKIETLREIRLRHVRFVLDHTRGDVEQASLILDIKPQDLRLMIQELGANESAKKETRQTTHTEE